MMRKRSWVCAAIVALMPLLVEAGQVYRWTDESGQIHFSDSPPPGTRADEEELKFNDNPDPDAAAAQLDAYQQATEQRRLEAEQQAAEAGERAAEQAERQALCDNARDIVSRLSSRPAARYQRQDGTYERYSNEEIEQRIAEAREREQAYCY